MKTTMKKLVFAALAAMACAAVPSSAAAATGDPCTLRVFLEPGREAGYVRAAPAQAGQYTAGQTVTLTATATNDFSFVEWMNYDTYEIHHESSFSFVITNDIAWSALFRKNGEYFINASKPWPGLAADPELYTYVPGTPVTLSAPTVAGHSIAYEIGRYDDSANTVNWIRIGSNGVFTMPAYDIWTRALYSIDVTLDAGDHGTATLSPAGPYYEGDTVTLTINPDFGYRAKSVNCPIPGNIINENTVQFTLDADHYYVPISIEYEKKTTVEAHFSVGPAGSGTVNATMDQTTKVVTATAVPFDGYHFICWLDLESNAELSTDNPYSFTLAAERNIAAIFGVGVVVNPGIEHGILEIVDEKQVYNAGDTVTLLGHPDNGYVVDYYAAGEIHNGSAMLQHLEGNSFVMPAWDMLVSVVFARAYAIGAAVSPSGAGTVTGTGTYKAGDTVTLTAQPADGYTFTSWTENGSTVSTDAIYSFTATENRSLTANFQSYESMTFTISAAAVPAEGGMVAGAGTYEGGETVTLTATAASGHTFLHWTENGVVVGTDAVYTFTVNGNRTFSAVFKNNAGVSYVDANGDSRLRENYTMLSSGMTSLAAGWYAAAGNVRIADRIEIGGSVNLILCDGASLTVPKGIHLTGANSLTIWGQNAGTGALVIESPGVDQAGIGGNELQPGGIFTMNGGTLTVTGGQYGAGIGGGGDSHATVESVSHAGLHTRGWAGTITINGGTVMATGGERGAGIGCGWRGDGGTVTISGGTVTAVGGTSSAGIGGAESSLSFHQSVAEIRIAGGSVTAIGSDHAAGIGGGRWGRVGTIVITGGVVNANGGVTGGAGIGSGYFGAGGTITIGGGAVTAVGGKDAAGIGGGRCTYDCNITISDGTVVATGGVCGAGIGGGLNLGTQKYTGGSVTITGGHVTATGGCNDGSGGSAGIGGGGYGPGGDITISGGVVEATRGDQGTGAGIGGGFKAGFGTITITGGSVRASGVVGQCIGHGEESETDGTLVLGNAAGIYLRVGYSEWIGGGVTWVGAADRENACRRDYGVVFVEQCEPHDYDRTGYCARCGSDGGPVLQYVSRVNSEGQSQGDVDCLPLATSTVAWNSAGLNGGWYAVTDSLAIPDRIEVSGNVNLILCDGATLTAPKGIDVAEGNSLTIWRQSGATGALFAGTTNGSDATCAAGDAAIGGASGENAGTVTVNGGNVTAIAGVGAQAIGHGAGASGEGGLYFSRMKVFDSGTAVQPVDAIYRTAVCRGSWVRLADCLDHPYDVCRFCDFHQPVDFLDPSDGILHNLTDYSAFLGQAVLTEGWYVLPVDVETGVRVTVSGNVNLILCDGAVWTASTGVEIATGSSLTVWAQSEGDGMGALIATGASGQAGIENEGGSLIVNGGTITATGGDHAAGIGGDDGGGGGSFALNGGIVTATGSVNTQAIGRGRGDADPGTLNLTEVKVGYPVGSGDVGEWAAADFRTDFCRNTVGATVRLERCSTHVDKGFVGRCDLCGGELIFTTYEGQIVLDSGVYVVLTNRLVQGRIQIHGDVGLILCDGVELTVSYGIHVSEGNSLTIFASSTDPAVAGRLTAEVDIFGDGAGIGGDDSESCGTVTINGGTVNAWGCLSGAGIGGGPDGSGGTITVNGGTVNAMGGLFSAGIGGGYGGGGGTITINGGTVNAAGSQPDPGDEGLGFPDYGAAIGGGKGGVGGQITVNGGTVNAKGTEYGAGIGGGANGNGGQIMVSGGTVTVRARNGAAIGRGSLTDAIDGEINDGSLAVNSMKVGTIDGENAVAWVAAADRAATCRGNSRTIRLEPCTSHTDENDDNFCDYCGGYGGPVPPSDADGAFLIASTNDWNAFAASVAAGMYYVGETVRLAADVGPVSTMVGTGAHSFRGLFDGDGHTLTVAISGTGDCAAPFSVIDGATILNLVVTGTVAGGNHSAGLVGTCGATGPNVIRDCTVSVAVSGTGYLGGIVGHGGQGTLSFEGCVFSGAVSGFSAFAGGLMGWSNSMALNVTNCLSTGTFAPSGGGAYHPIACKFANRTVTATIAEAYYLNTLLTTTMGGNLIPGAEGTPVSATLVAGEWAQPVTAADGNTYYAWTPAPAGRLLARFSFDDAGNGGLNLLHAAVGQDAIVRATQTAPVAGIGNITAVTDAAILSGLAAGDGAVAVTNGQYLAVPIPAPLLSALGQPYTVVMKIRVPNVRGWRSLVNMPASNDTDAMIYLQESTRNIYLKQFNKASGYGVGAANGFVPAEQWATLTFAFGENATDVWLDGRAVLHRTDGSLAGSYADCAAAGGYILVGADDSGDDDLFYLSDFRIYEGAASAAVHIILLPGSGTPADPYVISSTADWNTFASNVCVGVEAAACYRLAADISVTETVGTQDHPFGGTFNGGGHTLTANLSGTDSYLAPFSAISGATISNLVVAGTVAGNMHCSGLVGCVAGGSNTIADCKVAAAIISSGSHFGGFVGHGGSATAILRGCVFSGSLSGGTYVATFNGWSDDGATTTLIDCLDASASTHPIGRGADAACVSNTYYFASKDFGVRDRMWSEGKRGGRAYSVTGCDGVTIDFGAPAAIYGTAGITAYGTGLAYRGSGTPGATFYAGEGDTVRLDLAATPPSGMMLDAYAASAGTLSQSGDVWVLTMPAGDVVISATFAEASAYELWAAANGVAGAWDATDASGIHNVFRYIFDVPTGAITNPPLLSISFDASGNPVIHTPPLNPAASGFDISILASDDLTGTGATTYPLDPSGSTTIPQNGNATRFFRLQVLPHIEVVVPIDDGGGGDIEVVVPIDDGGGGDIEVVAPLN